MTLKDKKTNKRRDFLKTSMLGTAALAGAAGGLFGKFDPPQENWASPGRGLRERATRWPSSSGSPTPCPPPGPRALRKSETAAGHRLRTARRPEQGRGSGQPDGHPDQPGRFGDLPAADRLGGARALDRQGQARRHRGHHPQHRRHRGACRACRDEPLFRRHGYRQGHGRRDGRQGQGGDPQCASRHHHPRPAHQRLCRWH